MTEEEWQQVEGNIRRSEKFHFFVKNNKEQSFWKFLAEHHLDNDVEERLGNQGLSLFLIPLAGRKDYSEIRDLLNKEQPAYLSEN